ncbi:N-acetyldiaminopimelate deacetylase [uncultured Eubacterium sp.]|nr:N-acetyldiaminopimelate deacetylase [uncultured Eubacterium sp.]
MIDYNQLSHEIIQYRRDLHQIPELGFYVYKTSAYVQNILAGLACEVEQIVKTGLIAYFDFGRKETVAFRADMDALPIQEETGLPYASSHEGCMHACGHDGHMAGLLGFAKVLDDYKKNNVQMPCNALLLFQPAEETIDGALRICGTHIFDRYNIKAIFGLHLWPMLSKGEIASRPGPMMAKSTAVAVEFEGVSAHCGEPEKGKDALEAACKFVSDIYTFKSLYVRDRCVLKFGKM